DGLEFFRRGHHPDLRHLRARRQREHGTGQDGLAAEIGCELVKTHPPTAPGRNDDGRYPHPSGVSAQPSFAMTACERVLPSARPSVRSCTSFMTCPMSLREVAPTSAMAAVMISSSFSALSGSGR